MIDEACPFCPPLIERETILLANDRCLMIATIGDGLPGSAMIIPRAHRPTAFDLTDAEWAATYGLLREAREQLDRALAPDGYTLGWNCGAAGGQHVFHAHLHVIPRFADEPYAGRGLRHWLKQPANRRPAPDEA